MSAPCSRVSVPGHGGLGLLGCEIFLLVATGLSLAGWGLSLAGQLHGPAYAVVLAAGAGALLFWMRRRLASLPRAARRVRIVGRRWRRPLPFLFAVVFFLAALGGLLYPPNNYDALTYRIPPVLHWLDAGHWHWIATSSSLFNINPPGVAWWMAPLLALTRSDRAFFLQNLLAFATMPAAFFIVLRGCGVRWRVAWTWMWLLPTGYCFALQAGSIGNDLLPAAYMLTAIAFAVRGRQTGDASALWLSMLAAALATGVKVIPAPLGLVWLAAIAPAWRLLLRPATVGVVALALVISFAPTALLNLRHTGDWSGDPTNFYKIRLENPAYGLLGNGLQLAAGNAQPPVWPASGKVNRAFDQFQRSDFGQELKQRYPRFGLLWGEMATEETAGLGLGLSGLALWILLAAFRRGGWRLPKRSDPGFWIGAAALLATLVFCAKMGSESAPRLAAPYYPFLLIPLLRLPVNDWLVRQRGWRVLAVLAAASALPPLILTPSRPLWPAPSVLHTLASRSPESAALRRALLVYGTYAQRHDYLAPLKTHLPPDLEVVGFIPTGNDLETTVWKPYGSRRVIEILTPAPDDPALAGLRGGYLITSLRGLADRFGLAPEEYAARLGGQITQRSILTQKAALGPEEWIVIKIP